MKKAIIATQKSQSQYCDILEDIVNKHQKHTVERNLIHTIHRSNSIWVGQFASHDILQNTQLYNSEHNHHMYKNTAMHKVTYKNITPVVTMYTAH